MTIIQAKLQARIFPTKLSPNLYIVQSGQTIQAVIDSCSSPTADNPFEVMVPPGYGEDSYTERDHVYVVYPKLGRTYILTENLELKAKHGRLFFIDPNGSNRDITFAGTAPKGHVITIKNIGVENLVFKAAVPDQTIVGGYMAIFYSDGTIWR